MRNSVLVSVFLVLSISLVVMFQREKRFGIELTAIKTQLEKQSHEVIQLREQRKMHEQPVRTISQPLPQEQAGATVTDLFEGASLPTHGLNQLTHEYEQQEQQAFAAEANVFELAKHLSVTAEDLNGGNPKPDRLKPFFAAIEDWKAQTRILRTVEMRLKAEQVDSQLGSTPLK